MIDQLNSILEIYILSVLAELYLRKKVAKINAQQQTWKI